MQAPAEACKRVILRRLSLLLLLACALPANAAEVVRVAPWELHSSFWMSLHQTLIDDAMRATPRDLTALSPEDQKAWHESVASYRTAGGHGDLTFAKPMMITNDAISQVADDAVEPVVDAPLADALKRAAPVYRTQWWVADDKANRFFIAYAAAMLREAGADLVRAHEAVYRTAWPQRILVYVSPYGGPFGAYTMTGRAGGVITTMSSRDAGYQGLRALEMLLHESSHAVVNPVRGTVATAISAAAKKHGVEAPHDLWHALLFATSSELTRRLLAERGVAAYQASSEDLFTRVWPRYREAVEKYWIPYADAKGTLEDAIDKVVGAIAR
ncbi:MAG TPA: hypothetical protein VIA62_12980 [Thermoanaerobaculia bacterium]|jgi:hypothetical protein|nr:hypothetical protein [Thermoanaerobaculia bacterium]